MITSICTEISLTHEPNLIETIYLGGGTPSVLGVNQLEKIIHQIYQTFKVKPEAEVTLEVNPDDLSLKYLLDIRKIGINRLSIGVQSFYEEHLTWMNRSHTREQAIQALKWVQETGFESSSIDLIYGFKGLELNQWKENIRLVLESGLHHLSCYALTIEAGTPFFKMQTKADSPLVVDDKAWEHFKYVHETLESNGWDHYELSNFAKQGHTSKHNQSYWQGKPYIGIGPGAHSFNGTNKRFWNLSDNWKYIDLIKMNNSSYKSNEDLNQNDRYNEKLMVGLRTATGISKELIQDQINQIEHPIHSFLREGMAKIEKGRFKLTLQGWWQSDFIISTLFRV